MPDLEIVAEGLGPSDEEWHTLRHTGLGGSDAAAACGLSPFRSAYDLWAEKIAPDPPRATDEPEYMTWGRLLEDPIALEFSRRTELEVHDHQYLVRSTKHPFMLANVDRLVGTLPDLVGVLEVKTTAAYHRAEWEVGDDGAVSVPIPYQIQGMHYLAVTGLDVCWFACLIGGQELRVAEVTRDEELIDNLVALEADFWARVMDETAPPVDGSSSTRKLLSKRWAPEPGKVVDLAEMAELWGRRGELSTQIVELEGLRNEIDAQVMVRLGDADTGQIDGQTVVTWKESSRTSIDITALKRDRPDLAAEYAKTTTTRRFLPK
jgi:putative phage-type endonuclease